jgi:hypothetical protein
MFHLQKQGRMPAWRLALWAILAMAGVGYFLPSSSPRLFWGCVLMTGAMIVGFAYWLYWVQSSQWLRGHYFWMMASNPGKVPRRTAVWLIILCFFVGLLVSFLERLYSD